MAIQYTSLIDIWTSRPDLQGAFPQGNQAGTEDNRRLNDWWNQYGVKEYPNVTLVPPGDSRANPNPVPDQPLQDVSPQQSASQTQKQGDWSVVWKRSHGWDVLVDGRVVNTFDNEADATAFSQAATGNHLRSFGQVGYNDIISWVQSNTSERAGLPEPQPTIQPATTGQTTTPDLSGLPDFVVNDPEFQALSPDLQQATALIFKTLGMEGSEDQARRIQEALDQAKAIVDPFTREKINLVQDQLRRNTEALKGDFQFQKSQLDERIKRIEEDLATGLEDLSIDEQAELARQKQRYEVERENLMGAIRRSGMTFSSKRALAEIRQAQRQGDIVESTRRQFQRRTRELQRAAERGSEDAARQLEDLQRRLGEGVTAQSRAAEQQLGTANLPQVEGVQPLGGLTGTLEQERQREVVSTAELLAKFNQPSIRNPFL